MKNKVVVITGIARGIGKGMADAFLEMGAHVVGIDKEDNPYYVGDIGDEQVLVAFSQEVIKTFGHIDLLVNNACYSNGGLENCDYEAFNEVLRVGVSAPFRLVQLMMNHFTPTASVINITSTRYNMSQANSESYTAAKGAITSLTHAMAITLRGKVRVNAIAPGWIDTTKSTWSIEDHLQHPVGRVGVVDDIVQAVIFLASEHSSFITGQVLTVDGGMSKQMIYHQDHGWTYNPDR